MATAIGSFENKHVVVTGGTGALGTAVVAWFLQRGGTCHIPVLKDDELKRFPHAQHPGVKITRGVELTDEAAVEAFYAALPSAPALWASVHIAGGFAYQPTLEVRKDDFVRMMQMNALTCFLCSREAVKRMTAHGAESVGGRIVNVAARPALEPRAGANMVAYTASKAAVAAMTQAMAEEFVSRGILINAVVPSIMDTPANRGAMPTADHSKWATVESVAATIGFLASSENVCTRGGLVPVYGAA